MNRKLGKDKGFTLVELIVVLVILAVLAALLVPALLGYIDKAKEKQTLLNAKACVDAAQAQLSDLYGRTAVIPDGKPVISGATDKCDDRNEDQVITETDFAKEVLNMADMGGDKKPYFFMIGIGSNAANNAAVGVNMTDHEKYTVYYAAYKETKDSTMLYFYNGAWTKTNPRFVGSNTQTEIFTSDNVVKTGELKGKRIQYYVISLIPTNWGSISKANFWNKVKALK